MKTNYYGLQISHGIYYNKKSIYENVKIVSYMPVSQSGDTCGVSWETVDVGSLLSLRAVRNRTFLTHHSPSLSKHFAL